MAQLTATAKPVAEFEEQRSQLMDEQDAVYQKYRDASPQVRRRVLAVWLQRTQPRWDALRQAAERIAEQQTRPEIPFITEIVVDHDTPAKIVELVVRSGELYNDHVELMNQFTHASNNERAAALSTFEEQNREEMSALAELAKSATKLVRQTRQIPTPPLDLPPTDSAATEAVLRERHALLQEHAALEERIRLLSDEEAAQERERWQKENQSRHDALIAKLQEISHN